MTTGYITHPDFLKHEMGSHHPECPERIQAINDQLIRSGVDRFLHHLDAPLATEDQLELVHSPDHVSFVRDRAPESGYFMLDGDTIMNPHTYRASLRAAGAAIAGVDAVMKGEVENVFCAVRPRAIMLSQPVQWAFVCLITSPLLRVTPWKLTALNV